MKFFEELGKDVLQRWHRANFDHAAFADLACEALLAKPPSDHVDPDDVTRWVLETDSISVQPGLDAKFGEPAVTVFYDERFYIEVLFWLDGTTSIHQHRFSGAFHVMRGASIESVYGFTPRRRHSAHLLTGDLALTQFEHLRRGAVRPIHAGSSFIHALFHLERPSVSVVVRTPIDPESGPQFNYSRAGFALDPFVKLEAVRTRRETLKLLLRLRKPDEIEQIFEDVLRRADPTTAAILACDLRERFASHEQFLAVLERAKPAHEELMTRLGVWAEDERRALALVRARGLATRPEHRLFLATLLNLHDRVSILGLVKKAIPDRDPVAVVTGWLEELAKLDAIHAWVGTESNVSVKSILDVPMNEETVAVARRLLAGTPDEGPIAAQLRGSLVLAGLFRDPP